MKPAANQRRVHVFITDITCKHCAWLSGLPPVYSATCQRFQETRSKIKSLRQALMWALHSEIIKYRYVRIKALCLLSRNTLCTHQPVRRILVSTLSAVGYKPKADIFFSNLQQNALSINGIMYKMWMNTTLQSLIQQHMMMHSISYLIKWRRYG